MNQTTPTRRRPREAEREAIHRTTAIALALGQAVRAARLRLGLTQAELGARVGVQQSWISRIELGHGGPVALHLWIALGVVLGRPLAMSFSKPLGQAHDLADAGHLAMQECLLALARATGRDSSFELPTRPADPRYSIDVCVRDPHRRVLVIEEAWNTFGDLGLSIRSTNRKTAEATELAASIDAGPPYRVATVWIVRSSATNCALVARYPQVFHTAFPGSSRGWARALTTGAAPPAQPGLVWLDPASGQISEWRRGNPGAASPGDARQR